MGKIDGRQIIQWKQSEKNLIRPVYSDSSPYVQRDKEFLSSGI